MVSNEKQAPDLALGGAGAVVLHCRTLYLVPVQTRKGPFAARPRLLTWLVYYDVIPGITFAEIISPVFSMVTNIW